MFDLIIKNADIATASERYTCDIGIQDGRITALAQGLEGARETVDASGYLVLPGGVDAHCHLDQPMPEGVRMADDFLSGTRSAACGGTTTVIPFAAQEKGQSLRAAVDDYHQRAHGKAAIDYAFHLIVADATPHVLEHELPELVREGYTSFKIYMTYDDLKLSDLEILKALDVARREGALVMIHAESADCITWLTEKLSAAGQTDPRYHAVSRPSAVEREATHRAITLSELVDVPILIVHVSGREAIAQIHWAQGQGLKIYAETCPQYLFLTQDHLDEPHFHGAKFVCSPPPRDKDNQQAVWNGLEKNIFSIFSSDHAPFNFEDPCGKKLAGQEPDFQYIPNGIPGLETRLPLLFSAGVNEGRINVHQFVALTATNPAKLYGLYPRKGSIVIGGDADLVLWKTDQRVTIRNEALHHAVDYTPYEGTTVQGWPMMTFSRGKLVSKDFRFVGETGAGQFMPCQNPTLDGRLR
ncbi:MAG TPA: dihydropyrimidinase [Alcaligenes sp.]|nr:dihydropyrimidinase [Alcaligenes sp.]HRL27401.1 dihydropyrimidinase [Alcaligenes sp.]